MRRLETTKTVKATGNSACVFITKEIDLLDVKVGDTVRVIIEKIQ